MMEIYWLEQLIADVPLDDEWLSAGEQLVLAGLKVPKRRADWRLGRWTAKQAIVTYRGLSPDPKELAAIEIRPAASGAPEMFLDRQPADVSISLSHSNGRAACAISPAGSVVGCDLELIEPRSDTFIGDYFTETEQRYIAAASPDERDRRVTILWSAKESALKALRTGLRIDTRAVSASIAVPSSKAIAGEATHSGVTGGWNRLSVRYEESQVFSGWWQWVDGIVRTVVSVPCADPPVWLNSQASGARRD